MATPVEPAGVPPSPSTLRATIAEWWRADRALLAAILLIAVAIRVAWVFGWTIHEPLEGDSIIYQAQANNLTDGYFWVDPWRLGLRQEVVPQADHPPLFVPVIRQ